MQSLFKTTNINSMQQRRSIIAEALLEDLDAENQGYEERVAEIKAKAKINRANDLSLGVELFRLAFRFNSQIAPSHLLSAPWEASTGTTGASASARTASIRSHADRAQTARGGATHAFGYVDRFAATALPVSVDAGVGSGVARSGSFAAHAPRFGRPSAPPVFDRNATRIGMALQSSSHLASSSPSPSTASNLPTSIASAAPTSRLRGAGKPVTTSARSLAAELGIVHDAIVQSAMARSGAHGFTFAQTPRLAELTGERDSLGPGAYNVKTMDAAFKRRDGIAVPMSSESKRGEHSLRFAVSAGEPGPGAYDPVPVLKHTPAAFISPTVAAPELVPGLVAPGPGTYRLPPIMGNCGAEIRFPSARRLIDRRDTVAAQSQSLPGSAVDIVRRNQENVRTSVHAADIIRAAAQRRNASIAAAAERRSLREFERIDESQRAVLKWRAKVGALSSAAADSANGISVEVASAADSFAAAVSAAQQSAKVSGGAIAVLSAPGVRARSWLICTALVQSTTRLGTRLRNFRMLRIVFQSWIRATVKIQRAWRHYLLVTNTTRVKHLCGMLRSVFGTFVVNFRIRRKRRAAAAITHFLSELKLRRKQDLVTMARVYKRKIRRIQFWWRHRILPKLRAQAAALVQQMDRIQLEVECEERLLLEQPRLAASIGPAATSCPASVHLLAALAAQDKQTGRQLLVALGFNTQAVDANGVFLDGGGSGAIGGSAGAGDVNTQAPADSDPRVLVPRAAIVGLGEFKGLNSASLEHLSILDFCAEIALADDDDRPHRFAGSVRGIPIRRRRGANDVRRTIHFAADSGAIGVGGGGGNNDEAPEAISPPHWAVVSHWLPLAAYGAASGSLKASQPDAERQQYPPAVVSMLKRPLPHALKLVLARHILRCKRQAFILRCKEWRKRRLDFAAKRERSQEAAYERARLLLTLDAARASTLATSLAQFDARHPRPFTAALLQRSAAARVVRRLQAHVETIRRAQARVAHAMALAAAMGIEYAGGGGVAAAIAVQSPSAVGFSSGTHHRVKLVHRQLYEYASAERELGAAEESLHAHAEEATMAAVMDSFASRLGGKQMAPSTGVAAARVAPVPPSGPRIAGAQASRARRAAAPAVSSAAPAQLADSVRRLVRMAPGVLLDPEPFILSAEPMNPRDFNAMRVLLSCNFCTC